MDFQIPFFTLNFLKYTERKELQYLESATKEICSDLPSLFLVISSLKVNGVLFVGELICPSVSITYSTSTFSRVA